MKLDQTLIALQLINSKWIAKIILQLPWRLTAMNIAFQQPSSNLAQLCVLKMDCLNSADEDAMQWLYKTEPFLKIYFIPED